MIKNNIALTLIFASTITCNSQVIQLRNSPNAVRDALKRIDILDSLAYHYIDVDNKIAEIYSCKAFQLSTELGDTLRIIISARILGSIYRRTNRIDSAL